MENSYSTEPSHSDKAADSVGQRGEAADRLNRERILDVALRLVDEHGLGGLTMRRLGAALSADPMSLYRHVDNKEALLDGIAELLWAEVKEDAAPDDSDWKTNLRQLARSLRGLAHTHPNAYTLLSREAVPESALGLFDDALGALEAAGFQEDLAAQALRTLVAYGIGHGSVELSCFPRRGQGNEADGAASEVERLMRVVRKVPRDVPAGLVEVACAVCDCDTDAQFEFGLDVILAGLEARRFPRGRQESFAGP